MLFKRKLERTTLEFKGHTSWNSDHPGGDIQERLPYCNCSVEIILVYFNRIYEILLIISKKERLIRSVLLNTFIMQVVQHVLCTVVSGPQPNIGETKRRAYSQVKDPCEEHS